jgi:hypothetical protein
MVGNTEAIEERVLGNSLFSLDVQESPTIYGLLTH